MTIPVLILAPRGRDAEVASALLATVSMKSVVCKDVRELIERAETDALFAVVTEEALRPADLRELGKLVGRQAPWSDFQFLILTNGDGRNRAQAAAQLSDTLRNVSFLERPFHPSSFTSLARTAQKGRNRQFEARARIEELRENQQRLTTALSAGRLGAWELDLDTMVLRTTPTCRAVFGYGPDETFGYDSLRATIHPDDRERMQDAVSASVREGIDYSIEYRTIWRDATEHWAAVHARVINRGTPKAQMVGVSADVTQRRTSELELQRLNETLEARVNERTFELEAAHQAVLAEIAQREKTEKQLRQSQKVEMIGQLTGGVAHDFNNLLMAVLGNLELLRKNAPQDPKISRLIDGAEQGARRGAALTQRLLAFARRQELSVEPASVTKLVSHMTDLLDKSVGVNVERRVVFSDNVPPALIDVNQVELALLNLVVNSRDAMPEGGTVTIEVDTAEVDVPGDLPLGEYVRLSVTDTGLGMDAETLKKATEPFFSTKELGKGTGLGLSMIQGLAQQLNGALRLDSEIDKGTRAELWLPVADRVEQSPMPLAVESAVSGSVKATILAVDDDMLIAMSTVDMLEDLGHIVIEANSAADALEIIRSGVAIDLLITDFSMPKMNGAQLAKAARELRPELPVILATGYAELPEGYDLNLPRLAKPYQQKDLEKEIQSALS